MQRNMQKTYTATVQHNLWKGFRFSIPLALGGYLIYLLLDKLTALWGKILLHHFGVFTNETYGWFLGVGASVGLTLTSLIILGHFLGHRWVVAALKFLVKHVRYLRFLWSDHGNEIKPYPVLFPWLVRGAWKIGERIGEQKMSDGTILHKIFYITGLGDHVLIDKSRPDLLIPLENSTAEMAQLIGSLMTSGPEYLVVKKREGEEMLAAPPDLSGGQRCRHCGKTQ